MSPEVWERGHREVIVCSDRSTVLVSSGFLRWCYLYFLSSTPRPRNYSMALPDFFFIVSSRDISHNFLRRGYTWSWGKFVYVFKNSTQYLGDRTVVYVRRPATKLFGAGGELCDEIALARPPWWTSEQGGSWGVGAGKSYLWRGLGLRKARSNLFLHVYSTCTYKHRTKMYSLRSEG